MKRCITVFSLSVLLAGCKGKQPSEMSANPPQTATAAPQASASTPSPAYAQATSEPAAAVAGSSAKWDWQKYDEENFETQPSQGRVFAVPENATRLRVQLTASSPIDAAAMTRDVFKSAKGVVREDRLVRQPCATIGVQQETATCSLDPKESVVYVVRDRRALSADPVAIAMLERSAKRSGRAPAMLASDKIHVVLSVWACVANCSASGATAR
jgi:hypothetical protein